VKQSTAWALVGSQFGLLAGLIVLPSGDLWSRGAVAGAISITAVALGIAIGVAGGLGLGATLTPLPIPKDDGELVTNGVYHFVRHPIYSGLLLATAGIVVWGASLGHLIGWVALWGVLMAKSVLEEKMLHERYPEYQNYASITGRLVPKFRRQGRGG